MKNLKVYFMGKKLCEVYPHATRFQVLKWKVQEFLKKVLRTLTMAGLTMGILYGTFMAGAYFNPVITYATREKIVPVQSIPAVMKRIAKCESHNQHLDPKTGQVRTEPNTNKTVDIGLYQINEFYWGAKATELGYNLFIEKDNEAMAMWIYNNHGTGPWEASRKCWQ